MICANTLPCPKNFLSRIIWCKTRDIIEVQIWDFLFIFKRRLRSPESCKALGGSCPTETTCAPLGWRAGRSVGGQVGASGTVGADGGLGVGAGQSHIEWGTDVEAFASDHVFAAALMHATAARLTVLLRIHFVASLSKKEK